MRRRLLIIIMCLAMMCMAGCDSGLTITSEQNDLIAEYISGVLLKYSNEYYYKYVKLDQVAQQETTAPNETEKPSESESATEAKPTGPMAVLADKLGGNLRIGCMGHYVGDVYPKDGLLTMPATDGNKLIAVEFNVINDGEETVVLNAKDKGIVFSLEIDDNYEYAQAVSIFSNDIARMTKLSIDSKKSATVVALFMVPDNIAANINHLDLTLYFGNSSQGTIRIK